MTTLDKIKLPENIDDITLNAVRNGKVAREKSKTKGRNKKVIIAASITACLFIGAANSNSVIASIGNMMHKMETFFYGDLKADDIKDYKSSIGVMKESNGVKVTLNEYFMDDEDLYINARFESRDGKEIAQGTSYKIFIDGKEAKYESTSGSTFQYNDDKSVDMLLQRNMPKVDLNNVKDIKIVFNSVTYLHNKSNYEEVKGNWKFDFKFNGENISSKIKNININKTVNLDNGNITIHSVKVTPMKVAVKLSLSNNNENESTGYTSIGVLNKKGDLNTSSDGHGNAEYMIHNIMMDTRELSEITLVPYKAFPNKDMIIYKDKGINVKIK